MLVKNYWKYGRYGFAILAILLIPPLLAFTRITLLMDYLFFPILWNIRVREPVFIMGHPRSGSTFFQKQIYQADRAAMFTTWEMLFPSLTVRMILRPIITGLKAAGVDILQTNDFGHQIKLDGVEEQEALFLHRLDSEMLHILCPWLILDDETANDGFRFGWEDMIPSDNSVRLLREFLKRQIYYIGHPTVIAKLNPSVFRLQTILEEFPDARIVYLVRKPEDSIRSFLSFQHKFVRRLLTPEEQAAYFRHKYKWSLALYRYFEYSKETIPEPQLLTITFTDLIQDTAGVLHNFFRFTDIAPAPDYWKTLSIRLQKHTKGHTNQPISEFGLRSQTIEDDVGFLKTEYDL